MESLAPSTEYVAVVPLFESPSDVALEALFVEPHPVNRPTIKAMPQPPHQVCVRSSCVGPPFILRQKPFSAPGKHFRMR